MEGLRISYLSCDPRRGTAGRVPTGKMFDNIMIHIEEQKEKLEDEPEENPED